MKKRESLFRPRRSRVVLAYSGGLDTSVAIPWLAEQGWEVVAVAVDLGQPGDLGAAVERAKTLGAVDARLVDARARFGEQFVLPALKANALYQGRYPLISALSRPLISQVLVEVAKETGADAVAHGCTGKGNDQVRFEVSLSALAPELEVLAPIRDWAISRSDAIEFAQKRGLPIDASPSSPYSIDENLWGRSIECGVLEDPWATPPADIYRLTRPLAEDQREIEVSFDAGRPVAIDGEVLEFHQVIEVMTKIAGAHGFGRVDMIEDRLIGIKSREIYESPAGLALITAHSDLEALVLERAVAREKRRLASTWADLVYEGLWFSPLRAAIDAFVESTQTAVTGDVRLSFSPGSCTVTGRRSQLSLYDHSLATYSGEDAFDHSDAVGFIRLWGLPVRQWAKVSKQS